MAVLDVNSLDPFGDGSLKHFYKFDNSLIDAIANEPTTAVGTIEYVEGKYDKGVKTSNEGGVYLSKNVFTNDGTINIWVKPTVYKDNMTLFNTHNLDGPSQFVNTLYVMGDGKIQIAGRGSVDDTFTRYKTFNEVVPLNEFTMLTFTKTSSRVEVYKNGVLLGGVDKTSFDTNAFRSWVGYDNSIDNADGTTFDHLQIFDRVLIQEEVVALYTGNMTTIPSTQPLSPENQKSLFKEFYKANKRLLAQAFPNLTADLSNVGGGIVVNANPTYKDSRVTQTGVDKAYVDNAIANKILEITPKYQPKQYIYTPAPDGLLPIFKVGDYIIEDDIKEGTNSSAYRLQYNGALKLIYLIYYKKVYIYKQDFTNINAIDVPYIGYLGVSPNGLRMVTPEKSYKWDGAKYIEEATLTNNYSLHPMLLNGDGKSGIGYTNKLVKFTINDFGEYIIGDRVTDDSNGSDSKSSITPDGQYIATTNFDADVKVFKKQEDGTYLLSSQILVADIDKGDADMSGYGIAISIDGTKLLLGLNEGYLAIFNLLENGSWEQQQTIKVGVGDLEGMTFDWKGDKIYVISRNYGIYEGTYVEPVTVAGNMNELFSDNSLGWSTSDLATISGGSLNLSVADSGKTNDIGDPIYALGFSKVNYNLGLGTYSITAKAKSASDNGLYILLYDNEGMNVGSVVLDNNNLEKTVTLTDVNIQVVYIGLMSYDAPESETLPADATGSLDSLSITRQ